MRIQVLSDLHLEFDDDRGEAFANSVPVRGDVLVLAGDIFPLCASEQVGRILGWLCARFPEVVYVTGNHEYYRSRPAEADRWLADHAAALANLHVLDGATVTLAGQRFVGASLWFPLSGVDPRYRAFFTDFRLIEGFVPWVSERHAAHLAFFEENVAPGDVVISHHLPHPRSIRPRFAQSPINGFLLAADAAHLVETRGARLWIHGHTHLPCDYTVGVTRVVCNPRGYPHETFTAFNPELVVDLGDATRAPSAPP
jgi:predicted phosphodiesterase